MMNYLLGGAAIVIIILGGMLKGATERNGELEAKLVNQIAETKEAIEANITGIQALRKQEDVLQKMVAERRADRLRRESVLVAREKELSQARAFANKLMRERDNEVATNKDCADFSALDVGAYCPAAASQLRERARGQSGHEDRDNRGPG